MITNDARQAWAIARDNGLRSQHEVIVDRLETGCDVQVGVRGSMGAGTNADYAKVHRCITEMKAPRQAVGDFLNCRGVLCERSMSKAATMAALAIAQIAVTRLPGYAKWSADRQRQLYWVALAALERVWVVLHDVPEKLDHKQREEGRTLDAPWKIGKWLRGHHGQSIDLNRWGQQWAGPWQLLQDIAFELDDAGQIEVENVIGVQRRLQKAS